MSLAERAFYLELQRLINIAGLTVRALEARTSSARSPSDAPYLYSKSQWARWINGHSRPPRKAIRRLASLLAEEDIDAAHLANLWDRAFAPAPDSQAARSTLVPQQLPAGTAWFTGRAAELNALTMLAEEAATATGTVVISLISGTAGVGKTALALQWAHQAAHRFPDGQLFVNLRGYEPSDAPVAAAEAIRDILGTLNLPGERMPTGLDAQAALYRSLLAGRRMLVILDNAFDADQVRPLLPGSPGCMVIITTRSQLTSLIAAEGARPLTVDLLSGKEARELMTRRIGARRMAAEPEAAAELLTLCARLPLALCIVTARAAARPSFPLAALIPGLRDTRERLDALDARDGGARDGAGSVRVAISCSYVDLSGHAALMFRLLALHPGPDVTAPAAASLAAIPVTQTRGVLDELTHAHLLAEHVPGRFGCHDLLRAFAEEQTGGLDSELVRRDAVHRVVNHYLHTAHAGALLMSPGRDPLNLPALQTGAQPEHLADGDAALAWFEAERKVLQSVVAQAAKGGFELHAWQLVWAVGRFLDRRGYWHDWHALLHTALPAAERLGDKAAQAQLHGHLGIAETRLGLYQDAYSSMQHALGLYRQLGDRKGEARTHQYAGMVFEWQGRYSEALHHALQALELFRGAGQRAGEADALNAIGWFHAHLRDYEHAVTYCHQALDLYGELGDRHGEAAAWDSIGYTYHQLGDHARAATAYERALSRYHEFGNRYYEADTLTHLGDTHHAAGNLKAARDFWKQALDILTELQHPDADKLRDRLR
jgi:tetratricopeptide (TPR) repeat protein